MTPSHGEGAQPLSSAVVQYEVLRHAAFGHALAPEARSGLLLFLRRGLWGWAQGMAKAGASLPQQPRYEASLSFATTAESSAVTHIFAAMVMSHEHQGATP